MQRIGDAIADKTTAFMATWMFIFMFLAACLVEIAWNRTPWVIHHHFAFDPSTIILNLFLSLMAAIQGSVIMMSQNRQMERDRALADNDRKRTIAILHMNEAVQDTLKLVLKHVKDTGEDVDRLLERDEVKQ